ncbi:MAG: hypothetical protein R2911_21745 [Caldilineaceae bacterium]
MLNRRENLGRYFEVQDQPPQVIWQQPIQPRTNITITVPDNVAQGAFFEGGDYTTYPTFNPVVTRVITQTTQPTADEVIQEPVYTEQAWRPTTWDLINSIRTPAGRQQRLVVIPGQYRYQQTIQTSDGVQYIGEQRLFTKLDYTLYYSTTRDTIPPAIWQVTQTPSADATKLTIGVESTDFSTVVRVAVAFTYGDGKWQVKDLARGVNDQWSTVIDFKPNLSSLSRP